MLPAGVEMVTVTAGVPLALLDGTWIQGRILFTGPGLVTIGEDDVVAGGTVAVDLVDGTFSKALVATDATGMSPTGWTYKVTTQFKNAPNWVRYLSLPKAVPLVKLADVLIPDPVVGEFSVLVDPAAVDLDSLGLGNSATRDVGNVAGTVPDGADPRFTDARPPTGAATGDHTGSSYPALALAPTANVGSVARAVLGTNDVPSSLNYTAWTDSPRKYTADQLAISGTVYLAAIDLPAAANLTAIVWHVAAVGVTPTAGQCWVGLYDSAGVRRAAVGVDADITSTGRKVSPISYAAPAGRYYAAFVFNAGTSPQLPRLAAGAARATLINGGLTGAALLYATNGTGTALPATVTLSASVAGIGFFAALI